MGLAQVFQRRPSTHHLIPPYLRPTESGLCSVAFDSEAAVNVSLAQALQVLGRSIEVTPVHNRGHVRNEGTLALITDTI